jgi:signal peptidase II
MIPTMLPILRYLSLFASIIGIDVVTKRWALAACQQEVFWTPFVSCQVTRNRGIAWGMFHAQSMMPFILVTTSVALIMVILSWHLVHQWRAGHSIIGEVCVLAGASANMIDRLVYAGVIDFIALGYGEYTWPLFNIADVAVVCGVLLMVMKSMQIHEEKM